MTDSQIIALALVFVASLGAILFNNSRITDLRTDVNTRMNESRADFNTRMNESRTDFNTRISELRADMNRGFELAHQHIDDKFSLLIARFERMEDNVTRILGDHETRLQKLESKNPTQ